MSDTVPFPMPDGLTLIENLDFEIDMTREFAARNLGSNDTILSVTWTVPTGLIQGTTTHSASTATIFLSADVGAGAALGKVYTVDAVIATISRTYERSFSVTIVKK